MTKREKQQAKRTKRIVKAQVEMTYAQEDSSPLGRLQRYIAHQNLQRELSR